MSDTNRRALAVQRPWDARLARRVVAPFKHSRVLPNHLTTVRLCVGLGAAAAFLPNTYAWSNVGALLVVLSNFLDHTDGELARMSGKTSRCGHWYDLASDVVVTVLLFIAIGVGIGARPGMPLGYPALGAIAGGAVAITFYVRMRMEDLVGKSATRQGSLGGFESEDVLYLIPLVTLFKGLGPMLVAAAICAPLYALWASFEYRQAVRRQPLTTRGLAQ